MRNNLVFTIISLVFIIVCIVLVLLMKDNSDSYIKVIEPEAVPAFADSAADTGEPITEVYSGDLEKFGESDENASFSEKDEQAQTDKIININTATLDELMTLTGIGETIGQRIIDYRTENGAFSSIEEITEVKGIGEKNFEKIKDRITVW